MPVDYRNAIADQLTRRRSTMAGLPPLPPLGASPAQMARQVPVVGTPVHRPPTGVDTSNPLLAGYRAAAGDPREDADEWTKAIKSIRDRWNQPQQSDEVQDYIYGDREMGPR